jgi:hypothetical protein
LFFVLRGKTIVGAVEMWKSRQRFPGAVGREENLLWFSSLSIARHFLGAPGLVAECGD